MTSTTPCTLGRSPFEYIEWPGPIISYSWRGAILPTWLVEETARMDLSTAKPMERAVLTSVRDEATPNYALRDDDPLVVDLLRAASERVGGGVDIAGLTFRQANPD